MEGDPARIVPFEEFVRSVRERWATPFAIVAEVLAVIEPAVGRKRPHRDEVCLALDMLAVQAYKALVSVQVLAEHGHMEDAATIARRLLELTASAGYIGHAREPADRADRARRFLAALWHELPVDPSKVLPPAALAFWKGIAASVPRGAALPAFQSMFASFGRKDTYDQDYRLLAAIAHGASPDQLVAYSSDWVEIRPLTHLGSVIVFAARYTIGVFVVWNDYYDIIPKESIDALVARATSWPEKTQPNNVA